MVASYLSGQSIKTSSHNATVVEKLTVHRSRNRGRVYAGEQLPADSSRLLRGRGRHGNDHVSLRTRVNLKQRQVKFNAFKDFGGNSNRTSASAGFGPGAFSVEL